MLKIEYITQNDGKIRKDTTTHHFAEFDFLGDSYSVSVLNKAETVKSMVDASSYKVALVKDKYNRLFLYGYNEEMNFNDGNDRIDEMWSLVKDEDDAKDIDPIWGRTPSIYCSESGHTHIEEYVDKIPDDYKQEEQEPIPLSIPRQIFQFFQHIIKHISTLLLLAFIIPLHAQIKVDKSGQDCYAEIQTAIDAALPGTIIYVHKGVYRERLVLKDSILLFGFGNPVIDAGGEGAAISLGNHCTIRGFSVVNSGSERGENDCGIRAKNVRGCYVIDNHIYDNAHYGIIVYNAEVKIYHNTIAHNAVLGIYILGNSNFDIAFNLLAGHSHSGVDLLASPAGKIYNNIFIENKSAIVYENFNTGPLKIEVFNNIFFKNENGLDTPTKFSKEVRYNCFHENTYDWFNWEKNKKVKLHSSNILGNPLFADYREYDFSLSKYSPCIESGMSGCNIGLDTKGGKRDWGKNAIFKMANARYSAKLEGVAINHTAGDIQANVSCQLTSDDGIHYLLEGQYNNLNLFGRFEMTGTAIRKEDSLVIEFDKGVCYLGNDNSGYPVGTEMPHTGILYFNSDVVTGNYLCGKVIPLSMFEQYGSYTFYIIENDLDNLFPAPQRDKPLFTPPVDCPLSLINSHR